MISNRLFAIGWKFEQFINNQATFTLNSISKIAYIFSNALFTFFDYLFPFFSTRWNLKHYDGALSLSVSYTHINQSSLCINILIGFFNHDSLFSSFFFLYLFSFSHHFLCAVAIFFFYVCSTFIFAYISSFALWFQWLNLRFISCTMFWQERKNHSLSPATWSLSWNFNDFEIIFSSLHWFRFDFKFVYVMDVVVLSNIISGFTRSSMMKMYHEKSIIQVLNVLLPFWRNESISLYQKKKNTLTRVVVLLFSSVQTCMSFYSFIFIYIFFFAHFLCILFFI